MHMNHNNNYSSSDLISWLNSRHYSHPKFKIVKIEVNFWRMPLNFFNCSRWNSFNFYINFWISLKNLDDLEVWPPFWARLFLAEIAKAKMKAKHQDHSNFLMKSKNSYKNWKKKLSWIISKVDLNFDNFELWMTAMSAVESADQIWWSIIVVMVHMHHSQPLKIKFMTNHFLVLETLVLIQYRQHVKNKNSLLGY